MDKTAFVAWAARAEGRYELVEGQVVMMPRSSRAHARIVRNLVLTLTRELDSRLWEVISEFGFDPGPQSMRYPDVVVDRAGGADRDYAATSPVLVAEVLSPSTADVDLGDKVPEYLQAPSLQAYVVLSQDEPKAWVWVRADAKFNAAPTVISGLGAGISVLPLGLNVPLADIYVGTAVD